jgi:signal transduction histidine kinase
VRRPLGAAVVHELDRLAPALVLEHDDGAGFDSDAVSDAGLGLRAMRDRVAELGGTLTIQSSPGAGTVVRAVFILRESP